MKASLMNLLRLCVLLLSVALAPLAHAAVTPGQSTDVTTDAVTSQIVASHATIRASQTFTLAWHIRLEPKWHVYWRNPGDSGLAPLLTVRDESFKTGEMTWPVPEVISIPPITNYGYEDDVVLLVKVNSPDKLPQGNYNLPVRLEYLYCNDACLPGRVDVNVPLTVAAKEVSNPAYLALEVQSRASAPKDLPDNAAHSYRTAQSYHLVVDASAMDDAPVRFIPMSEGWLYDSAPQKVGRDGNSYTLEMQADPHSITAPDRLGGLLLMANGQGYRVLAPMRLTAMDGGADDDGGGLGVAMFLAFLAGLILNLMPCVLPVLALKVFGLMRASDRRERVLHTLAYGLGVVLSFWAFAIVIALLQNGGAALGWGFHMQNPLFVAGLVTLMTVLALNFWDVFGWGSFLTRLSLPVKGAHESYGEAFVTGLLAVLVATPCTVPFMGGAMAYAMAQPLDASLLVFTSLGVGLVAPLLALSAIPAVGGWLPKPGAWMVLFRQLLGWPLLATGLWLLWVFGQQTGVGMLALLLAWLVLLTFTLWVYGKWQHTGLAILVGMVLALGGWHIQASLNSVTPMLWEPWSNEAEAAARKQGPVFVDFTADWCLTCKVTEATVLGTARVNTLFEQYRVTMMRADWTRRDAAITAELESHQRRGVPLYLMYLPGKPNPVVLPQLLTYGDLEKVLSAR